MICKLCLKNKRLVEAHIIPEFMYQELYDTKHFFYKVGISNSLKVSKLPQGIYDEGILCEDCDNNIINKRGENYASKVLYGGSGLTEEETPKFEKRQNIINGMTTIHISNLNYKKFKGKQEREKEKIIQPPWILVLKPTTSRDTEFGV